MIYLPNRVPPPLTTKEFYVLLALQAGATHIYQLKARILNFSLGGVDVSPGNLYPVVTRMAEECWVVPAGEAPTDGSGGFVGCMSSPKRASFAYRKNSAASIMRSISPRMQACSNPSRSRPNCAHYS